MKKTAAAAVLMFVFAGFSLAADAKAGAAAYDKSCKGCHGATGAGNPAIAKMLSTTIPELGSAEVQGKSDGDLAKVITDGKGKMKGIKTLSSSPEEVVAFLRTMKK